MPVVSAASGSQVCTVTTEHTVAALETANVFVFMVDLNPMVAGDVFELRIKKMVLTAGTVRVCYFMAYYGAQPTDDLIKMSIPVAHDLTDTDSIQFTIKQTFGTSRTIPWKVLTL
jgi:hypothetical protein